MVRAWLSGLKSSFRVPVEPDEQRPYDAGREYLVSEYHRIDRRYPEDPRKVRYEADEPGWKIHWRRPELMPDWAARIKILIEAVSQEHLQDIDREGLCAEGFPNRRCLRKYWNKVHRNDGHTWETNPLVWVFHCKRLKPEKPLYAPVSNEIY